MSPSPPARLPVLIQLKKLLAFTYILAERLIWSFGLAALWLGFWTAIIILGLVPEYAVWVVAIVFWFVFTAMMIRGMASFLWPADNDILRRLEKDSGVAHRPLRDLDDAPVVAPNSVYAKKLWAQWQSWKHAHLTRLRWPVLWTDLAARDPFGLRFAVALMLIAGFVMSGPASSAHIRATLWPWTLQASELRKTIRVTITPPAYTGQAQILIAGPGRLPEGQQIIVPEYSRVKITAEAKWITPDLKMGDETIPFKRVSETSFALETDMMDSEGITIRQFFIPRMRVPYLFVKDQPPVAVVDGSPVALPRGEMRFPMKVTDDYGVAALSITARPKTDVKRRPWLNLPYEETRAMTIRTGKDPVAIKPVVDFTAHPLAGIEANVVLSVADHAGQTATLPAIGMTLPERKFENPVAAQIAKIRKELIWTGPYAAMPMSYAIENILYKPGAYNYRMVVTLLLRSSASRLLLDQSDKAVVEVIDLLWAAAMTLEDGNLTEALKSLRQAQEDLNNAIQNMASIEDIQAKMQKLREAMAAYMQSLQKEVQQRMAEGKMSMLDPEMLEQVINPDLLDQFLGQIEQDLINGDIDKAMEKLSQMQKMMEQMDPSMAQGMPQELQDMSEQMQQMQDLIDQQQSLLDKTREQAELMKKSSVVTAKDKDEQERLRFKLGEIMQGVGESFASIPPEMDEAEMAMRQSSKELADNRPDQAAPHQQEALDKLQKGQQQMQQQMAEAIKTMMGFSFGQNQPTDPLGRSQSNRFNLFNNDVKIPTEAERKRIDDIIETLRERAGDQSRSTQERDYYKRLLQQW